MGGGRTLGEIYYNFPIFCTTLKVNIMHISEKIFINIFLNCVKKFHPLTPTYIRLICIFFLISLIFRFPDLICLVTVFEGERCIITSNLNSRDYPSKKRKNLPFFVTGILFLEKSKKVNSIFFLTKKYRALTLFINKPNSSKNFTEKCCFYGQKKMHLSLRSLQKSIDISLWEN